VHKLKFFRGGGCKGAVAAIIFAGLALASPVFGQTVMSVSDIAEYALTHSRDIAAAEKAVADAQDALSEVFEIEKSSLKLSGGYDYTEPSETPGPEYEEHSFDADASITIPIIPELSLSASLGSSIDEWDPSGSLSLRYEPFGDSSTEWKEWETLRKAEIQLADLQNTIPMSAEEAAFDLIEGQLNLESAERSMTHAENEYEIAKKRYDLQDITYTELEEYRTDASATRQKYYNSQKSLLSIKKNLYQIIGPDLGDIEVSELSTDSVLLLIAAREEELTAAEAGEAATVDLLNQAVELEALKQQLEETPVFEPTISVTGSVSGFDSLRASAGVSVTFSPDQIQTDEREEIETDITDKEFDLSLEQANVELEAKMLKQNISVAREALDISISDYDNSLVQYEEAKLLFDLGERTELELEESELSLFSSSIALFASAVDLYMNLGELLGLYLLT